MDFDTVKTIADVLAGIIKFLTTALGWLVPVFDFGVKLPGMLSGVISSISGFLGGFDLGGILGGLFG